MKHPSEVTLALFAGHDLAPLENWRTRRHVGRCPQCREEVARFSEARLEQTALDDLPGIAWSRLAAEMKANIRVGLAAGECIREAGSARRPLGTPLFAGARLLVACVSVAILLLTAVWLGRPAPSLAAGISLQSTVGGIEVRQGDRAMVLQNGSAEDVTYSAGAQGSIGARYVDPGTGYVTINTVYVQ